MYNLFRFLSRYHFILLFLLFEAVALSLTASHQHFQQMYFLHSANAITARLYQATDNISEYLSLKTDNQQLLEDYTSLLNQQRGNFMITDKHIFEAGDSLFQRQFTYQHARVINNSVIRRNNYFTLNKGRLDGVEPDMGVITPNGLAGIVANVSDNFSVVMSMLHSDILISVKIQKNDHIGSLRWEGGDYRKASMLYIPPHVELTRGDTIVSSGFSTIFPENILVGTIDDWEIRRGDSFFTAEVELAVDFNKLTYVYVVKNLMKEEQEELEASVMPDS